MHTACAILFTFMFREVCHVYAFGGLNWYFTNRHESIPAFSSSELFNRVSEMGQDNYKYESERIICSERTREHQTTFLTARLIADGEYVLGTVLPLSDSHIFALDACVRELDSFYSEVSEGNSFLSELRKTTIYKNIYSHDCEGQSCM